MTFRGGPVLTLDAKGRLTVPARWREQLVAAVNGQLVVCKHPHGCLSLYPVNVWEPFEAQLMALPQEHDAWRRLYIGSATDVEIDSASRVLIPPELRRWADLEREVKFLGMGSSFELWDIQRYEAREATAIALGAPEALRSLVIR
jgi:MraZ protein